MKQERLQVAINLTTTITDNEQQETNTSKQVGRYFTKDTMDVLMYEEKLEEDQVIKNLITIQPEKINIKRTGAITMNQQFLTDRKTESFFEHPHGRIHMETFTNKINYEPIMQEDKGELTIFYTVKLNGQAERKHKLTLTYNKGEAE